MSFFLFNSVLFSQKGKHFFACFFPKPDSASLGFEIISSFYTSSQLQLPSRSDLTVLEVPSHGRRCVSSKIHRVPRGPQCPFNVHLKSWRPLTRSGSLPSLTFCQSPFSFLSQTWKNLAIEDFNDSGNLNLRILVNSTKANRCDAMLLLVWFLPGHVPAQQDAML